MLDKEYIYQAMRNQRLLYLTSRGRPYNFPAAAKGGIRSNTSGGSDPSTWILATGIWRDEGIWDDNALWID